MRPNSDLLDKETRAALQNDRALIIIAVNLGAALDQEDSVRLRDERAATRPFKSRLVAAIVSVTVLAVPTLALSGAFSNLFSLGAENNLTPDALPGRPYEPDALLAGAARKAGVDKGSIHLVTAAGTDGSRLRLFAGVDGEGKAAVAAETATAVSRFVPVSLRAEDAHSPLIAYMSFSFQPRGDVEGTIVGFASPAIRQVEVVRADDRPVHLRLAHGGSFEYVTRGTARSLPIKLRGLDTDGRVVRTERVSDAALCGAAPGRCAAVVVPARGTSRELVRAALVGGRGQVANVSANPGVLESFFKLNSRYNNFQAPRAGTPRGGFVLLYLLDRTGMPAVPARYFPLTGAACFSWDLSGSPNSCIEANAALRKLLAPARALPTLTLPTVLTRLRFRDGGDVIQTPLRAAAELAFAKRGVTTKPAGRGCRSLRASWSGPSAASRPRSFCLSPSGFIAGRLVFPAGNGLWERTVVAGR
jgi:hypothetical protein